jgi:lipoprotein-releasing system permease protein
MGTSLKIVGISEIGIAEIDNVMSYTSLSTAQKLLGQPKSYITDLQVNLYDKESAVPLAKEFHTAFNLDAIDYQTANSQFETGSTVRSIISCSGYRFACCCWFWNLQHIEYDDL